MRRGRSARLWLAATALLVTTTGGAASGATSPSSAQAAPSSGVPILGIRQPVTDSQLQTCTKGTPSRIQPAGIRVGNGVEVVACFSRNGVMGRVAPMVTFQLFGVGAIAGCGGGPAPAGSVTLVYSDGPHGLTVRMCHVTNGNFPSLGVVSADAGQSRVLFCADPDRDGCLDEPSVAQVAIGWVSSGASTTTTTRPPTTTTTRPTTTTTRPPTTTTTRPSNTTTSTPQS